MFGVKNMSASRQQRAVLSLAKRLGGQSLKEASEPTKVGHIWRKATISAKNVARLMKQHSADDQVIALRAAKDRETTNNVRTKPNKGHKHDRLKADILKRREENLASMDARIADYRKKKIELRLGNTSALDRLVMTKKQLRLKARNTQ